MSVLRRRSKTDLLDLEDVERRLRPFERRYVGVRPIPLDRVVGTEGRAAAFTRDFEPRYEFGRDCLRSLAAAFPGRRLPSDHSRPARRHVLRDRRPPSRCVLATTGRRDD